MKKNRSTRNKTQVAKADKAPVTAKALAVPPCKGRSGFQRVASRMYMLGKQHNLTHGKSYGPECKAYYNAQYRCCNANCVAYSNYGGRGIKFLFNSFEDFYAEIGDRPAGMTLDRIDNDGHYVTGNVRWATRLQQTHNRR